MTGNRSPGRGQEKIACYNRWHSGRYLAAPVDNIHEVMVAVLRNGEHTGAKPGRVVDGPGRKAGAART